MKAKVNSQDGVVKILCSKSSSLIYSCSLDATVRLWDVRTGAAERVFQGHQAPIFDFALDTNEKHIITGSEDGTALVFAL